MALFNECMQSCALIVLDTADIVRDGDVTPDQVLPKLFVAQSLNRIELRGFARWIKAEEHADGCAE